MNNKYLDYSIENNLKNIEYLFNELLKGYDKQEKILSKIEEIIDEETTIDDSENSKALDKIYQLLINEKRG